MKISVLFLFTVFVLYLMGCSTSEQDTKENELFDSSVNAVKKAEVTPEKLSEILKSIPSPIETTSIIQSSGAKFNKAYLNPDDNDSKYITVPQKAMNLGVYSADMGYLNIYEETILSLTYLETVFNLSADLEVSKFFDLETVKRLSQNKKNIDSMIYISTSSYDKMNAYLHQKNRSHVSALILLGGWIETMYLTTQIVKENPSKELVTRLGEQKIPLSKIKELLDVYREHKDFAELVKQMDELVKIYDSVEITYVKGEPQMVYNEATGTIETVDTSTSEVKIGDDVLKNIIESVAKIRQFIIA